MLLLWLPYRSDIIIYIIEYEMQQSYLPQEAYPSAQETEVHECSFLSNIYLEGY